MNEPKFGYIKVELDYAPKTNGKKFTAWCEKYGFYPLNSGRRAWCSSLSTYFRGADGVALYDGEAFLFYADDVVNDLKPSDSDTNTRPSKSPSTGQIKQMEDKT